MTTCMLVNDGVFQVDARSTLNPHEACVFQERQWG
jgi:hypothetical protein